MLAAGEDDDDDDEFASCDEDEDKLQTKNNRKSREVSNEKNGDPVHDFYLELATIESAEEKSKNRLGIAKYFK
jgi:hypothetical protein